MARRVPNYHRIHAFEESEGLPLSEIPESAEKKLRNEARFHNTVACILVLMVLGGISFGLYEWWRPGKSVPPPPLPAHVYPVRGEKGEFVVDKGFSYLKRALCTYADGEDEPTVDKMPNGQEYIACMLVGGEGVESFSYPESREYVLH